MSGQSARPRKGQMSLRRDILKTDKPEGHPLTGKYFHRIEDNVLTWQGQILSVTDGCALAQLHSWLTGCESTQHMLPLKMFEWRENPDNGFLLYNDAEEMKYAYEYGSATPYRANMKNKASN